LPRPDEHDQGPAVAIDEVVDLCRESAAGAADRVIRGLGAQILVIPQIPLWSGEESSRADGPD